MIPAPKACIASLQSVDYIAEINTRTALVLKLHKPGAELLEFALNCYRISVMKGNCCLLENTCVSMKINRMQYQSLTTQFNYSYRMWHRFCILFHCPRMERKIGKFAITL
jgi:hypothetical protein